MKDRIIVIPSNDGETVCESFGQSRKFVIINVRDGKEFSRIVLDPPEHTPLAFPEFLALKGVETVITGGIGVHAASLFKDFNIDVIQGARGLISDNVDLYLDGTLESGEREYLQNIHDNVF